ncbi:RNA polymerase II elongation factor ELL3 [Cygnus atratus]|uniref:RNA polymerase II elongation factor ELL3 n=1 Tax=Cygnus atratus TaxID=8868 RepID=UPI0021B72159|nr:RNA polymerase II elongation factor ELL3 [Cygnus atratus]
MPRARTELRGRLRYRGCARGPRLSLLHVRLSEAAARALRGCQRRQCLTVPGGPGTSPRLFAFFLSRCSWDEPQASFECVRLAVPRLGQSWLDRVGSIQEKITVCASEGTYPPLRERVSQSKEPWSRAVAEPDVAVPGYGKGVTAPRKAGTVSVLQQSSLCHIREGKNHGPTAASPRAAAQSLVQLLALRPHRKHELLQRLAGTQAGRPDWAGLLAALEEVADLDPTECCYRLKESLVGRVQEDWPGYTAQERRQVALLQRSSQPHGPAARSFLVPLQQPLECGSPPGAGGNRLGVALEAKILYEYSHFKKSYPSYQQEKNRCEYLHQKLSHIKNLILQFEERGSS